MTPQGTSAGDHSAIACSALLGTKRRPVYAPWTGNFRFHIALGDKRMLRIAFSVAFALFMLLILFGKFNPNTTTAETAMWSVGWVGVVTLFYFAVNSFNALRFSLGQPARLVYVGLLFSFLPLLVAVYSIAVWQYSPAKLSTFQIIAMLFGGVAAIVDLLFFTWLTFGRAMKLARLDVGRARA